MGQPVKTGKPAVDHARFDFALELGVRITNRLFNAGNRTVADIIANLPEMSKEDQVEVCEGLLHWLRHHLSAS